MKSIKFLFLALLALLMSVAWAPVAKPSRPVLFYPISKRVMTDPAAVTLKWYKSTTADPGGVTDYDVEVSDSSAVNVDGSFVSTVDSGNVAAPVPATATMTYPIGVALIYGRTYYWHVQAHDGAVIPDSPWSYTGVFRVAVEPPTTVAFVAGPAEPNLLSLRPTFMWTPGMNIADSYTIQISTDCGFSTIYRTATISPSASPANQYIPTTNLAADTGFCWRIRANNATLGTSAWTTPVPFTSANPPTVPVLLSPANGSIVNDTTPDLKWKAVIVNGAAVFDTYQIQIFNSSDVNSATPILDVDATTVPAPVLDLSLIASTTYTVDPAHVTPVPIPPYALNPATTYYWRMRAYNTAGEYSSWSAVFKFTVGIVGKVDATTMNPSITYGNVPGLEDPTLAATFRSIPGFPLADTHDNFRLLSLRPKFSWDPGALNAQSFNLQVASAISGSCDIADPSSSTFASLIINVSVADTAATLYEYTPTVELPPNLVLCWRVRPYHSIYKYGEWSDVQIFLTANPPTTPQGPFYPSNLLNNDNHPELVWSQVAATRVSEGVGGATFGKYEIEISFRSDFKGYTYPGNIVPPYDETAITYPLAPPILPGDTVYTAIPIYPVIGTPLPYADCARYPSIHQAYDTDSASPTLGAANDINEPSFQLFEDPAGDPGMVLPNGALCGAHTYYWRVRAYNSYGEYSAWSTANMLPIMVDPPTNLQMGVVDPTHIDPTSLLPASVFVDTRAQDLRPLFTWDPVYHAEAYDFEIATTNSFGSTSLYKKRFGSTVFQPTVDLPRNKTLYWRVVSVDAHMTYGVSLPSEVVSFTTTNPPPTPILLTPTLNQLVQIYTPTLTWKPVAVPFGLAFDHYQIQISLDKTFTTVNIDDTTAPSDPFTSNYTVGAALTPMKYYFWRVRSCDSSVPEICSTWSSVYRFRTAISAPINLASDGTVPLKPVFSWDPVIGAYNYTVYYSLNPVCPAAPITYYNTKALSYTPLTPLLAGGRIYTWCVRANNGTFGPSAWSSDTYTTP